MLKFVLVFAAVATVSVHAARVDTSDDANGDWNPPSWYHDRDGPIFKLVKQLEGVEQREYEASKWVAVNISNKGWDDAFEEAKGMLNEYRKGNNLQGEKMDRTVPMFTVLYPTGQGKTVQSEFTIEYFLPHELHGAPPAPNAPELKVVDIPAYLVWVRTFGGFAKQEEIIDQAFGFVEQLKGQGVSVMESQIGVAIYDDPIHVVGRHNEIWVWEQPAPSAAAKPTSCMLSPILRLRNAINKLFQG